MVRVARKMVGNNGGPADIVQDIFIDLFEDLNDGIIIHNPRSWLYRATTNRCIDNLRKKKIFEASETICQAAETEHTEQAELRYVLDRATAKLKPRERALVAFYSEGMSYKELAEATGIRFSSIGKILSRSLRKLEKELNNMRYELY